MYDYILFDLDGTLSDSGPGIIESVRYALGKFGITDASEEVLRKFVGPPLKDSFMEYFGLSAEEAMKGIEYYREVYWTGGLYNNTPYPGMEETLKALRQQHKVLMVATGKPTPMAEAVLKHFGWREYFAVVAGAALDESRVMKHQIIEDALAEFGVRDPERCLMVGDREHDVLGARRVGIDSCGALYGYGSREELENAGARFIIRKPEDLLEIV